MLDPATHAHGRWCWEVVKGLGLLDAGGEGAASVRPPLHVGISLGGAMLLDLVSSLLVRCVWGGDRQPKRNRASTAGERVAAGHRAKCAMEGGRCHTGSARTACLHCMHGTLTCLAYCPSANCPSPAAVQAVMKPEAIGGAALLGPGSLHPGTRLLHMAPVHACDSPCAC